MTALQATYWPASADGLVLAQANGSSQPASASGLPQATTAPALDTSAGPLPSETDALLPQPGQHSSAFHVTVARDPPWPSASKTGSAGSGQAHEGEEDPENTRRVIASSIIGNTLEWYDFLIFVFLGSVISRLFFPSSSTYAFAAGFITRPLGAIIFGYIGDKHGRKTALTWSIYLMSIPTALVGCLPTYQQAGLAAPVLLFLIRVLQGFAVGGEFTSTMVFLVEHAAPHKRGVQGSWAFFSVMVGVITGSLVALTFNYALSESALYSWGWRVPFLLSIVGSAVGIYIRKKLKEPKTDEEHHHANGKELKTIALGMLTVVLIDFTCAIGFYLTVIFLPLYYQDFVGLHRTTALTVHTINMVVYMVLIPIGGLLSDRYGCCVVMLVPCVLLAVFSYPIWCIFKTATPVLVWLAQALLCAPMAVYSGVLPAAFVALFPPQLRCTGLSIGHNISMAVFGGTAPIVATALMRHTSDLASPAAMMIVAAVLSIAGVWSARRYFAVP